MKHPNQEEWMEFLYQETNPGRTQEMAGHLRECASCKQAVHDWQNSMKTLDEWSLPDNPAPRKGAFFAPWLKWAAAIMLCATAGFAWGRLAPRYDIQAIRSQLEQPMRLRIEQDLKQAIAAQVQEKLEQSVADTRGALAAELQKARSQTFAALAKAQADTQQMIETLSHAYGEKWLEDQKEYENLLARLENQRNDLRTLRKELETVAVLTQDSFVRLASLAETTPASNLGTQP